MPAVHVERAALHRYQFIPNAVESDMEPAALRGAPMLEALLFQVLVPGFAYQVFCLRRLETH